MIRDEESYTLLPVIRKKESLNSSLLIVARRMNDFRPSRVSPEASLAIDLLLLYTKKIEISTISEKFLGGNRNPNNNCCPKPYSDEYMIFDEMTGHYVLTSKFALDRYGIDLFEGINDRNSANLQIAVSALLKRVSTLVYNFIHSFTIHDRRQDFMIATNPYLRSVIQDAMGEQLVYMHMKGDLSRSTDKEKRELAIDESVKDILINSGICYSGV